MISTNNKKSFTLMELMVVIVIMGIVAIFAIPNYFRMIAEYKVRPVALQLERLSEAVRLYEIKYGTSFGYLTGAPGDVNNLQQLFPSLNWSTGALYRCAYGFLGHRCFALWPSSVEIPFGQANYLCTPATVNSNFLYLFQQWPNAWDPGCCGGFCKNLGLPSNTNYGCRRLDLPDCGNN